MRRILFLIFTLTLGSQSFAQDIGISPLEYNTDKYYRFYAVHQEAPGAPGTKALYPFNSDRYFIYDTLSLPFIDDFAKDRFKKYESWYLPAPVDSVARIYTISPQPASFPLPYRLTPTKHYFVNGLGQIDSTSIVVTPYTVVFFGDSLEPFIPKDTVTIWPITSKRIFFDTQTLTNDSATYVPDGTMTADSTDTIRVYFPNGDGALWTDNYTYRNISMGINPPTIGVVTFDGTNEYGVPYRPGQSSSYGVADYLTSKPINLAYPPSDSIYLSFFYQPQGRGYEPENKDSLVLEFYSPVSGKWHHVLNLAGDPVDSTFSQRMVNIDDTLFLENGFRFRFKNFANLSGNLDHWNIDYVRLDRNRTRTDTIIEDVAFVEPQLTILDRYMQMPYTQFIQDEIDFKWTNLISNLGSVAKEMCYQFALLDESGTVLNHYTQDYTPLPSDTAFIPPYSTSGYSTNPRWWIPDFNYDFETAGLAPFSDSATFTLQHYLEVFDTDTNPGNDTFAFSQNFHNYFAYDDGTAEAALWLGTPGYLAGKFTNNSPDTLRAIQIYFSPNKDDITSRYLDLMVWTDLSQVNGIHKEKRQIRIQPSDQSAFIQPMNNGFSTYILSEPVPLPAGDFYVGFYQNQIFKVNIGYDKNTDSRDYSFYKTGSHWDTLSLTGSMMIRPMVGPPVTKQSLGLDETATPDQALIVFPNPTQGMVNIGGPLAAEVASVVVTDISGKQVFARQQNAVAMIDLSYLPDGFYFLSCTLKNDPRIITKKIILTK